MIPCLMVGNIASWQHVGSSWPQQGMVCLELIEGHGKSMGARCYIQKFDNLVADCDRFFKSICGKKKISPPFFKFNCQKTQMFVTYF